jgi:predicted kinase
MQTITIVIGLPGSGKTTYIKNNSEKFEDAVICDDYDKSTDTHRHSHIFKDSVYYDDLKSALLNGKNVVLADIVWCKAEARENLKNNIEEMLKELKIKVKIAFLYFENNPVACKKNVLKRKRSKEKIDRELKLINEWSPQYIVPSGVLVVPVIN